MLTQQRKQLLLDRLKQEGRIVAKQLSEELGLSEDTIRRDLRELASEGLLQRVHGGALPSSPAIADYEGRRVVAPEAKVSIGRAAAAMILPGQVVLLDGGTTTRELARHIRLDLKATIVTHSPTVAAELERHAQVDIILIGGRLFKHSMVALGAAALDAIRQIRADLFFLGVTGIHPEAGLSTGDLEEAFMKRAMMRSAGETIVLASSEKLNAASAYVIAPISELSGMIVERKAPKAIVRQYEGLGLTVIQA